MGRVILDSSILIALHKESDLLHRSAVKQLRENDGSEFFISAISYAEFLIGPSRNRRKSESIRVLKQSGISMIPVDSEVAESAAEIRVAHNLKLPDALIVATAKIHKLELWTADKKMSKAETRSVLIS